MKLKALVLPDSRSKNVVPRALHVMWRETNLMCKAAYFPLIRTRSKDIVVLPHLFRVASSVDLMYVALMQNLVRKLRCDHARSVKPLVWAV